MRGTIWPKARDKGGKIDLFQFSDNLGLLGRNFRILHIPSRYERQQHNYIFNFFLKTKIQKRETKHIVQIYSTPQTRKKTAEYSKINYKPLYIYPLLWTLSLYHTKLTTNKVKKKTKNLKKKKNSIHPQIHNYELITTISSSFNHQLKSFPVDGPAVLPDLALVAGEHADAAHLADGVLELPEEVVLVGEAVDERGGAAVGEQRGVGGEEAPAELEVDEVVGVEPGGAPGVHGHRGGVVRRRPARRPQLRGVGGVQRRVGRRRGGAGEVEEAGAEEVAVAHADGVRPCVQVRRICGVEIKLAPDFICKSNMKFVGWIELV